MSELDQRLEETGAEFRAAGARLPDRSPRRPERRREDRRTVAVVAAVTLAAAVIAAPALWLRGDSGGGPDAGGGQTTIIVPSTAAADPGTTAVTTATTSEGPVSVSLGEPVAIATAPGEHLQVVLGVEGVLYASVWSGNPPSFQYRVVRSTDDGSTWETVLEANPAKNEGVVGAGEVVVLVINDQNPDTTVPSSVVSDAPTVFVFDPVTGATSATVLPRPADPQMEGLPQTEGPPLNPEGCDMGGYQSSISARAVAAGDRLVVTGSQYLVGRLADGTVICDVYRNLTWTSDDRGATWELHDGLSLGAITWTGTRYVAWSIPSGESPDRLVVSANGLDWTTAVATPPIPDDSIPSGTSVFSLGDTVVAWAGVRGPSAQDPIFAEPKGALIAVSNDDGLTWEISYVAEPVIGAVGIGDTYIALASDEGAPGDPSDASYSLLTSTDSVNWTHAIDLPGVTLWGPDSLTATEEAIYIHIYTGEGHAEVWRIPVNESLWNTTFDTTTTVVAGGEVTPVTVPEDDRLLVLGTIALDPIPEVVACSGFAGGVPVEAPPNQGGSVTLPAFESPIAALREFLDDNPGEPPLATSGYWAIPQTDESIVYGKPYSDADIGLGFVTLISVVPHDGGWTVASWRASGC